MIYKDVIIVGGGPAGATAAWRLNQNAGECLVLDQSPFPRPKLCAGWITPEVFDDLQINPSDYPYGLTKFNSFFISFGRVKFKLPVRQYAIRRLEFDDWLLQRAGVPSIVHKVNTIKQDGKHYIIDDLYTCQYLIGAGGTRCPVYRTFFEKDHPRQEDSLIVALEYEIFHACQDEHCRLWFMENRQPGYAWYVPKVGGYVNVGIGAKAEKLKANRDTLISHWQRLTNKLEKQGLVKGVDIKPKGHSYYLRQKTPTVRNGNALIVGDAVGLATLDMGEGIRAAIKSGLLAADAILKDSDYDITSIPRYSFFSIIGL